MKIFIFKISLFFTIFGFSQNTLGVIQNTSDSFNGYTLFSPRNSSDAKFTYLIDNCGEIINKWESTYSLYSTDYLMEDGSLFRSVIDNTTNVSLPGINGRIEHLDWDGNLIWSIKFSEDAFTFHHDFVPLENGNIIITAAYTRSELEAIALGREPESVNDILYEERLLEIEPVGTDEFNIVWEWHSWDHLIQDFDNSRENFGIVSDHPELLDINFYMLTSGNPNWWHSNSLSYSEELDQIIIGSRNLNEFYVIDHSTTTEEAASNSGGNSGMGGDILYRWGNPASYDQGSENDRYLHGQHNVQFIPLGSPNAGKILLFNNGNDLNFSRVSIINPPLSSDNVYIYNDEAFGPSSSDWEYSDPVDQTNFHAPFLSGAQELPNGNILICHGPRGIIFEVNPINFQTVWEYKVPVSNSNGVLSDGIDPNSEVTQVFRAVRYPTTYSAFTDKDLTPQGVIELNPEPFSCEVLSINESSFSENFKIYPIPTKELLTINVNNSEDINYKLYNTIGQVLIKNNLNKNSTTINISSLNEGVYFLKIFYSNTKIITKKIIKK